MNASRTTAGRVVRSLPLITRALAAEVRKAGTDAQLMLAQVSALQLLEEGDLSAGELARRMHVAMPTVTQSVDSLVARGLASRSADSHDRRQVRLHITRDGQRALAQSLSAVEGYARELLRGLTPEQREDLAANLERLAAQIEESASARV